MAEVVAVRSSLAEQLKRLDRRYLPVPFWFWNDALEPDEIRRQVREMAARHIGGFFMHARMGRVTPYMSAEWMAAVRAAVEAARETGLAAWIYDEDGWPSGYGGGAVNALGEAYLQQYALAEIVARGGRDVVEVARPRDLIAVFAARRTSAGFTDFQRLEVPTDGSGPLCLRGIPGDHVILFRRELHAYRRFFSPESWADGYVDVLNPAVTRAFIEATHELYRRRIGGYFGRTVPGVFTDEPSYHDHDWAGRNVRLAFSPLLAEEFAARYGAALADALALIAFGGSDAVRARWCYYETLTYLFVENYTCILADWCERHGLIFTGHYLLEESPRAATQVVGDVMRHYAWQHVPGVDHLGKPLDLRAFWSSARVLVKQAASVANQLDKPQILCEAFAGGGWDFGPLEQKWMGDWQYALGVSLLCPHALHYSLRGLRKRDYPPSFSFQQPWWPASADVGAHFARLGQLLTQGRRVVNVLVLHPIESFFATHDVAGCPWPDDPLHDALKRLVRVLLDHQIDFDFGNEVLLQQHGRIDGRQVVMGSARYEVVIVPHSLTWRQSTIELLGQYVANGGRLYYVEPTPTHIEGIPSDAFGTLLAAGTSLGCWDDPTFEDRLISQIVPAARPACRLVSVERTTAQSAGWHAEARTRAPACAGAGTEEHARASLGHATHGGRFEVDDSRDRDILVMHRRTPEHDIFFLATVATQPHETVAEFDAAGTPLLLDTVTGELQPMDHTREGRHCGIRLPFDYGRSFPIVFDRSHPAGPPREQQVACKTLCREGTALPYTLSRPNALILDQAELDVEGRSLGSVLLIDAVAKLREEQADGRTVTLQFAFHSRLAVAEAWLLCETPERFSIAVNGRPVDATTCREWFVDPSFRRLAIPGGLIGGENVVVVEHRWDKLLEFEPLYVLGHFAVFEHAGECRIGPLPDRLTVGSWHRQGLAFYAGSVTYHLDAEIDEPADRWELACPRYRSTATVRINGETAGTLLWAPNRVDVTRFIRPGRNRIDLEVANSLRNFLGPHHLMNEDEIECLSPGDFFNTAHRTPEYRFKPAGFLGDVLLNGYRVVRG